MPQLVFDSAEEGNFTIADGSIALQGEYADGQYIKISGSLRNDDVFRLASVRNESGSPSVYTIEGAADETFTGRVYALRVPRDFLRLCEEVKAYAESPAGQTANPYISESVSGVHSYTRATDKNGLPLGWKTLFAERLKPFRRMFSDV